MSTLNQLGISNIGNYVGGKREGISLNQHGGDYLNELFPSATKPALYSEGNTVQIHPKLPPQEYDTLTITISIESSNGKETSPMLCFAQRDDWFKR